MTKYDRYQDYVFKDGRVIGEFEEMYRDFANPWNQLQVERYASDKAVLLNLLSRLKEAFGIKTVMDLGCGLGHFTQRIQELGVRAIGVDLSTTAVDAASARFPDPTFIAADVLDQERILDVRPDAIVMTEITWYILDKLPAFLAMLRTRLPDAFILHSLTIYRPEEQRVGRDYFTNSEEVRRYFDMHYLEWGEACSHNGQSRAYFLGSWQQASLARWSYRNKYDAEDQVY